MDSPPSPIMASTPQNPGDEDEREHCGCKVRRNKSVDGFVHLLLLVCLSFILFFNCQH